MDSPERTSVTQCDDGADAVTRLPVAKHASVAERAVPQRAHQHRNSTVACTHYAHAGRHLGSQAARSIRDRSARLRAAVVVDVQIWNQLRAYKQRQISYNNQLALHGLYGSKSCRRNQ